MQKKLIESIECKNTKADAMMLAGWTEMIKDKEHLIVDLYEGNNLVYRFAASDKEEGVYVPENSMLATQINSGWVNAEDLPTNMDFDLLMTYRKGTKDAKEERILLIESIKDTNGYVVRHFDIRHSIENRREIFEMDEVGRKVYIDGILYTYRRKYGWKDERYWDYAGNEYYGSKPIDLGIKGYIYPDSLSNIYGYDLKDELGNKFMYPDEYINNLDHGVRGIFSREGLSYMLNDTLLKSEGKTIEEILGISRKSIEVLKTLPYKDMNAVKWLRFSEEKQIEMPQSTLRWLQSNIRFLKAMNKHNTLSEVFDVSEDTLKRAVDNHVNKNGLEWLRYLEKSGESYPDDNLRHLCYDMCSPSSIPNLLSNLGLNKILETMKIGKVAGYSHKEYILRMEKYPIMEFLLKAGLLALAANLRSSDIDFMEGNGIDALGINKEQYNRLKALNGDANVLMWLRYEKASNIRLKDEVLMFYKEQYVKPDGEYLKYTSPVKAMNYILKQYEKSQAQNQPGRRIPLYQVEKDWRDYIRMAERAKFNLHSDLLLKPKDLHEAHQALANNEKVRLRKEEVLKNYPDIENILAEVAKKYSYTGKEYSIVCPTSVEDILNEGAALGHCLANNDLYFRSIQNRESYIVFLRRNNDIEKPWYTIEIEPSTTIRQKRTTGDTQDESYKEAVKFLIEWQKTVKKSLSAEDLALGKISEELRNRNFEELFKNKTEIRNGLFKGKLLVDVLKEDLMVAAS